MNHLRSRRRLVAFSAVFALVLLSGCSVLEDNATHLAYALETTSQNLRASSATEAVVHYETLDGLNQSYYVEITPSFGESGQSSGVWSSYLVVSGKTSGGTSYHNRFVFVPRRLYARKDRGGVTDLVLRKEGDRISVVEIH
ncbi:MAG: hypothetical protein ACREN6_08955 [Gemmatimonadaceae bacterium]